jgi:hypothetical protein
MESTPANILISITHTAADGTLLAGDPRPHQGLVKAAGFRYSGRVGWYVRGSRDRHPRVAALESLAVALRSHGFDVTVELDTERRPVAEVEADRVARLGERAEGLAGRAERLGTAAAAEWERGRRIADGIPFGQPVLVGHHSEGRHRRDLARIGASWDRSAALSREADQAAAAASSTRAGLALREAPGAIMRRIERLETERRDVERRLAGTSCNGVEFGRAAIGAHAAELGERLAELVELLGYWREKLEVAEAAGAKVWRAADFAKGDRVRARGAGVVVRVNPTTLTVAYDSWPDNPLRVPFTDVVEHLGRA